MRNVDNKSRLRTLSPFAPGACFHMVSFLGRASGEIDRGTELGASRPVAYRRLQQGEPREKVSSIFVCISGVRDGSGLLSATFNVASLGISASNQGFMLLSK